MEKNGHNQSTNQPAAQLMCRGVRGATTVNENSKDAILLATRELLYTMIQYNQIDPDDVASVYFTTTIDLNTTYPATAARQFGWYDVPLLCGHELDIIDGLPKCVRILLHWNTCKRPKEIVHVYLHEAASLRPDKDSVPPVPTEEIEKFMALAEQVTS